MKHKNATGKPELEPTLYVQFSVSLCFISLLRDKLPQITRVPWFYWKTRPKGVISTLTSSLHYTGWRLIAGTEAWRLRLQEWSRDAPPEGQDATWQGLRASVAPTGVPGPDARRGPSGSTETQPSPPQRHAPAPTTRWNSQVPTPEAPFGKKQRGAEASQGGGILHRRWNCLRDGGGERHPAWKRRQGFSLKDAIRSSLPSPAGSCGRTPAAPAAVQRPTRSALTLTSPRAPPGQPRRSSEAADKAPEHDRKSRAALPSGARRRAAPL